MRFIGQHHIMNQLKAILPNLYKNPTHGCSILLKGMSGFGKTAMAHNICRYLSGPSYEFYLGDTGNYKFVKRVVFIDEVHTVKNLERFYPLMDDKDSPTAHVFVFATNLDGDLPEAFVNRCYEFVFDEYTTDELLLIARESSGFRASDEQFMQILDAGNMNPRIIKSLCTRLGIYFDENPSVSTVGLDFSKLINDFFRIENGLDTLCRRYIETLQSIGGTASLNIIKTILHVDESSIRNSVEPILIRKGILRITSKGRSLVDKHG